MLCLGLQNSHHTSTRYDWMMLDVYGLGYDWMMLDVLGIEQKKSNEPVQIWRLNHIEDLVWQCSYFWRSQQWMTWRFITKHSLKWFTYTVIVNGFLYNPLFFGPRLLEVGGIGVWVWGPLRFSKEWPSYGLWSNNWDVWEWKHVCHQRRVKKRHIGLRGVGHGLLHIREPFWKKLKKALTFQQKLVGL